MLNIVLETAEHVDPIEEIRTATLDRINHFLQSPRDVRVYSDLRGLCTTVSVSYRNRSVLELLQNAHDAHAPGETKGRIRFLLEDEGNHGVLYAANDGLGFTGDNLTALCSPTRTTKTVNEAIGNKGVGFLSVFQICAHPEVYSRPRPIRSPDFDGYCFSFADVSQLRTFLEPEGLADQVVRIADSMPQLYLALPSCSPPPRVLSLGEEGYATVLRLPLKNKEARLAVEAQLHALATGQPEVQLFLDRISELKIELAGKTHVLGRDPQTLYELDDLKLQKVACGSRSYIVARRTLKEATIRQVIEADLGSEALPESWADWKGDAIISLAVAASGDPIKGRLYTFLPMGEGAEAPLAGHLDAPFFATIERKNLEEGGTFNAYLMKQCRSLALAAATIAKSVLDNHPARHVVADLLFWTGQGHTDIRTALLDKGDLVIPAEDRRGEPGWASLKSVRVWENAGFFLPKRVAQSAAFPLVDTRLGPTRIANLRKLAGSAVNLSVSLEEKADVAVAIAQDLFNAGAPVSDWDRFYSALPELLPNAGERLQGRPILLTDRNELVLTEAPVPDEQVRVRRRLSTVFLPPLRQASALLALPVAVSRRMTYLNGALACVSDGANPGRKFLVGANLVREYDRREILRVIAGVIIDPGQAKDPDQARWEALTAILTICTGEGGSIAEADEIGLRVPARAGWVRATEAFFGGWAGTRSHELDDLFDKVSLVSAELASLSDYRLVPYTQWNVPPGKREAWIAFLKKAGVVDHLRPLQTIAGQPVRAQGNSVISALAGRKLALSDDQQKAWIKRLASEANLPNPLTEYTVRDAWRFPGQADYKEIGKIAAEAYAIQVVRMLEDFPGLVEMTVFRPNHSGAPNTRTWASPARSFLATEAWVPIIGDVKRTLDKSWLPALHETPPPQAPLVTHHVRTAIERADQAREILVDEGLSIFGEQGAAWRLLAQAGEWLDGSSHPAERLWALTVDAWAHASLSRDLPAGMRLLGKMDGAVISFDPRTEERAVYIADADDRSMAAALSRVARGVIMFEPPLVKAKDVASYLCSKVSERLQRMSDMEVVYRTPDGAFTYDTSDALLEQDFVGDLRSFVLLTVRYRCKFVSAGPDKILGKLSALRIRWVDSLELQVGQHTLPLPSFQHSAVLVNAGQGDTLLAPMAARGTDRELMVLAPGIGEAIASRPLASDAFYAVAARMFQAGKGLTPEGLAEALDVASEDVIAAMQASRSLLGALLHVARPFIRLWGATAAVEGILQDHRLSTEGDLVAALDALASMPVAGARLLDACRSGSVEAAALDLGVDLAALNTVLEELEVPYRSIDRTAYHEEMFSNYYLRQKARVRESIRQACRADFRSGKLARYLAARDAPAPTIPRGIGHSLIRSGPTDWALWLADWLVGWNIATLVELPGAEASLDAVRDANQKILKALAPKARLMLVKKLGIEAEIVKQWRDPDGLEGRLVALANAQGWLDFDRLDEAGILDWLGRGGLWPANWPTSLAPVDHGLLAEDLEALKEAERKAREERASPPPPKLDYTGGTFVVGQTTLASITDQISELADGNAALLASSSKTIKGRHVILSKGGSGGGDGGGWTGGKSRVSDDEKAVIGYFGEAIAFAWLKAKFGRNRVVDYECWKSGYRVHACGKTGEDLLGYDFEIQSGKATWFFEVKATASPDPGDVRMVELGSTEIAKAEVCHAENRLHYRILYVVNALKPDQATLGVLPNPRSEEGKSFYTEQKSAGVRLFFGVD
ncbi:ATP-binding protein [Mesorhizobium sp. LNHC229A00]|uniref:sacsin N-terminal ATP-binding-like domain-containing protein n=1 Tax=Mesorhizobium sp. LNHC229A00 TaxID=1287240 RepID=UPI0003CE35D1|nr:ATP-binding protein [Mesorhizobium sp. LNHC229A00]ESY96674.1 hypothetical protein X741_03465 [Mesorhizobium sp. LNHC229A00]